MQSETSIESQLKDAAQLAEAEWAVLAERVGGAWVIRSAYHLNKAAQNDLAATMSAASIDAWLCGALSGDTRVRWQFPKIKE